MHSYEAMGYEAIKLMYSYEDMGHLWDPQADTRMRPWATHERICSELCRGPVGRGFLDRHAGRCACRSERRLISTCAALGEGPCIQSCDHALQDPVGHRWIRMLRAHVLGSLLIECVSVLFPACPHIARMLSESMLPGRGNCRRHALKGGAGL